MEKEVLKLIEKVKSIVQIYDSENVYKEKFIDNENVLYYSVMLFRYDGKRDLAFYIEFYKYNKTLVPIICTTRKYTLYETINMDSVKKAIEEL